MGSCFVLYSCSFCQALGYLILESSSYASDDVCLHGFAEGGIKPDYLEGLLSFSALLVVRGTAFVVVVVIDELIRALLQGFIVHGRSNGFVKLVMKELSIFHLICILTTFNFTAADAQNFATSSMKNLYDAF